MKLGYPCINRTIPHRSTHTFRLASYTEERFVETVTANLHGLKEILLWNNINNLLFFRITSDLIPFASHPVCSYPWQTYFKSHFSKIGLLIKKTHMRISMHPDQFTLINSPSESIFENTIRELTYHAQILDLLELDHTAKIQIHVGGVYGDKKESKKRFIRRFHTLSSDIKNRLVIENDDRLYTVKDCLEITEQTDIPILFDTLHHEIHNNGETMLSALTSASQTWMKKDGIPLIDYSQQEKNARIGNHAQTLELNVFKHFIDETQKIDFDIMFEIKDKEVSALKALSVLK